jgi:PAS domain S-box-containing protein
VLKVSQAVSGEIVLDRLVATLLRTAIEQAGAERGVLIVPRGNELWIHAEARAADSVMPIVVRGVPLSSVDVPESVVRYAARAHEPVSLDDASAHGAFVTDDYIRREHARSVLCLPLLQQGELMALLYLENRLATAVFTPARMAVLNVVASQAAVSLEKTRLYQELHEHLTERKRAEEALRESEQRFRLAVESIPGLISILDANGEVEVVNGQVLTYFGKTLEELKHWGTNDCVHDDDRPRLIAEWMRSFEAGQPFDTEQRLRRADGVYRWFQTRGLPLRDGDRIFRWYMLFTDIDDRKCAEQILERSQLYLSEAQKLTHVGSWALQPQAGKLVHWSDELLRIFGFDPGAAPTLEDIVNRVHPDDREQAQQRSRQQSSESYAEEYRIMLPDGTVKHLHVIGHPIFDATGTVVEFIGTAFDITERKRAEAELRQAQAALAHQQRVSLLGEVAASLAHEIKQPIAAASIDAKVCLRALADDRLNVQAAREAATRLVKDAARADEVIKRTTALYKRDTMQRERVDINALIREMAVLFQQEAAASAVSVHTELTDGIPSVMADRVQLQQVFMNLVLNAIEAMKHSGGDLTIASRLGEDGQTLISVTDAGVGLPTENPDQIFDSFVTTKPQGTGMGLAITRSIVESHGGRLWATANSGPGATFVFSLPDDVSRP